MVRPVKTKRLPQAKVWDRKTSVNSTFRSSWKVQTSKNKQATTNTAGNTSAKAFIKCPTSASKLPSLLICLDSRINSSSKIFKTVRAAGALVCLARNRLITRPTTSTIPPTCKEVEECTIAQFTSLSQTAVALWAISFWVHRSRHVTPSTTLLGEKTSARKIRTC